MAHLSAVAGRKSISGAVLRNSTAHCRELYSTKGPIPGVENKAFLIFDRGRGSDDQFYDATFPGRAPTLSLLVIRSIYQMTTHGLRRAHADYGDVLMRITVHRCIACTRHSQRHRGFFGLKLVLETLRAFR
jgi:hypothetical protein